jgi:hypothetical protein
MTTVYVILAIIFLVLWTWGVLLFGKHNQNKVNTLQAETNKAYAAAKQKLEDEVLSLKAKLAAK